MLPALGLWENDVIPILKVEDLSLMNRRRTCLAAPILLNAESASPSQALELPRIGCSVVWELPKTMSKLGGADPAFRSSLSSAVATADDIKSTRLARRRRFGM